MMLPFASEEDVRKMTQDEYEKFALCVIQGLSDGFHELLNSLADQTILPRVAVLAALVEVAVTAIDSEEPKRSEDIAAFCRNFVERATGQEPS